MNLSVISPFVVCLALVSSSAFAQAPAREALYAINAVPLFGLSGADFGRFFDDGPRWVRGADAPVPAHVELPVSSDPLTRRLSRPESGRYDELISAYSQRSELDPRLVKAVIAAESEFVPRAKSPAGALGLMQVMPDTAGSVGVNGKALFDPEANIHAGTAYLAYLFTRAWKRYHLEGVSFSLAPAWLVSRVIAAYNAGPRFLARRKLYRQTREYVRKVLLFYRSEVTRLR